MWLKVISLITLLPYALSVNVVLWHGMGDSCCNPLSMGAIKNLIEQNVPGVFVYSIEIGVNAEADMYNSFFMNVNRQIDQVCANLSHIPQLQQGFHAIGFSQGGQFLRAVAQRCNVKMLNLISIGGQHQGVFGMPRCTWENFICETIRKLLNLGVYTDFVQERLVQAEYWHDSLNEEEYKQKSVFLADINQEVTVNQTYKTNLLKLQNFAMVKFTKDTMVIPKDSEWFAFYAPGTDNVTIPLEKSDIYLQDRLGLKTLDSQGKIQYYSVDGNHLQFTDTWFVTTIVKKYLV